MPSKSSAPQIKILFIDFYTEYEGNEESLIKETLEGEGWTVIHVSSVVNDKGLQVLEDKEVFDLILIYWWPDGRSLRLLLHARSIPHRKGVPVVMLYSRWFHEITFASFRDHVLAQGAAACVDKNKTSLTNLARTIRDVLKIPIGQTLKHHWLERDIKLNQGASEEELATFEATHNVRLPGDLRSYFAAANGFDGSEHWMADRDLITFLSLDEAKPVSQVLPLDINDNSYFVFADYSLSAHFYAIQLSSGLEHSGTVAVFNGDVPIKVADSFSEFAEGYMKHKNKRMLFPGPAA
ncbi:MAG: / family [Acidobacteriota bacterium]|jgi:CheY-like chemotaxis protein|nr:/ family [Acidobacteriota bacterium]